MTAREALAGLGTPILAQLGEDVWLVPDGDLLQRRPLTAVVDWSAEAGSNQVRGDGTSELNQDRGRSIRRSVIIDIPVTTAVQEDGKDKFQITNPTTDELELYSVKRVVGRDAALQSVLLVKQIEHQAQPGRRMG